MSKVPQPAKRRRGPKSKRLKITKKDKWGDAVVKEEDSAKLKEKVAPSRLDNLKNLVQEMDKVVI